MEGLKKSFLVRGNNIVGFDGSGEENTIESISVNGVDIAPDENKNIDITIPSIDGLTKDADLATVAKSGNYEDLDNKPEIPSVEGLAKTTDIPTKVSELENDSKYQTESDVTTTLTDYATKTYVGEQITNAEHLKREIVTVLPSDEEASDNIIYMLKVESATGDDKYQEYMKIDGAVQMVGDTSVDLTDYAKIAEIPTTVAELTDSADYAKTADIPTTLPANGGNSDTVNNHTVETDVPENALFTDTVYDDTEVKESISELNSNLTKLELSDIAGGKNLLNESDVKNKSFTNQLYRFYELPINEQGYMSIIGKDPSISASGINVGFCQNIGDPSQLGSYDWFINEGAISNYEEKHKVIKDNVVRKYMLFYPNTEETLNTIFNKYDFQLEKGDTPTPYKPYIPSVKMLADENAQQNKEAMDLKMLGWTVPKECPIQNYVDSNGIFHQRVGRICLYDCDYNIAGEASNSFYTSLEVNNLRSNGELYCNKYKTVSYSDFIGNDKVICVKQYIVIIRDTSCSDITSLKNANKGVYLYYELATEKTISVDGNEAVTKVKNDLGASNAGAHNSVYRGKYLGNALTTEQKAQISAGTFNDLYIGDYWTIGGVNYRIAAFDYWLNSGDTNCTTHHIVIVPDSCLYNAKMNTTDVTTGAYIGSEMYKTNLAQAKTTINNAFGSNHILSHRELLANITSENRATSWSWYDSTVDLMNESMVYGSPVGGKVVDDSVNYNVGIDKSQLPLFALDPSRITNREDWWLRDVVSAASFAYVSFSGYTGDNYTSYSYGVRPVFGIKG